MNTYAPGTVAVATVRGVPDVRVMRVLSYGTPGWRCAEPPVPSNGFIGASDANVTNVRPLVVLDFENPHLAATVMRQVAEFIRKHHGASVEDSQYADLIADQIEAQAAPPKPTEPTGLGAVVVDSNDVTWVLAGRDLPTSSPDNWRAFDGPCVGDWQPYARIDVVKVLGEGVTA